MGRMSLLAVQLPGMGRRRLQKRAHIPSKVFNTTVLISESYLKIPSYGPEFSPRRQRGISDTKLHCNLERLAERKSEIRA